MNRLQVRQQFRTLSGRFDLVNADGTNNGADFFIDTGQKWLDRKIDHEKTVGRVFRVAPAGAYATTFQLSRSIEEVWAATADDGRWQLEKLAVQDFKDAYSDMPGDIDAGAPGYYTPAFLRGVPETGSDTVASGDLDAYLGFADIMVGDNYDWNGIVWMPPCEEETLIEIWGKFYVEPLDAEDAQNYWSVNHPDILVMAGLRQVEVFNRNTQGRQDWERAIMDMLSDVDKDVVQEELAEVDNMEG
jgi:hypothetical protein